MDLYYIGPCVQQVHGIQCVLCSDVCRVQLTCPYSKSMVFSVFYVLMRVVLSVAVQQVHGIQDVIS